MHDTLDAHGRKRVTLIEGDGIESVVTGAARRILDPAPIAWGLREGGAKVFRGGPQTGVPPEVASIRETRVTPRDDKQLRIQPRPERSVTAPTPARTWVGADAFVESSLAPDALGASIEKLVENTPLRLRRISNHGTRVCPPTGGLADCIDHGRCRFVRRDAVFPLDDESLVGLLFRLGSVHRWGRVEKLEEHNGALADTRAQGED